jgi:hypothetical protein
MPTMIRSSLNDLWDMFDKTVSVRAIAELLIAFDEDSDAQPVKRRLESLRFDFAGVMRSGVVDGYVVTRELGAGQLSDYAYSFQPSNLLGETDSLLAAFRILQETPVVFVRLLGRVGAIVTRADCQKAPVRMFLFSLCTLIEMHMLRLVCSRYPGDSWRSGLGSPTRLQSVDRIYELRRHDNMETSPVDCLQLCDKRDLLLKQRDIVKQLGFASATAGKKTFKEIERLRDDLAHAQDIVSDRWHALAARVAMASDILQRLEEIPESFATAVPANMAPSTDTCLT